MIEERSPHGFKSSSPPHPVLRLSAVSPDATGAPLDAESSTGRRPSRKRPGRCIQNVRLPVFVHPRLRNPPDVSILPSRDHDPTGQRHRLRSCGVPIPGARPTHRPSRSPATLARLRRQVGKKSWKWPTVMKGYRAAAPEHRLMYCPLQAGCGTGDAAAPRLVRLLLHPYRVTDMIVSGGE